MLRVVRTGALGLRTRVKSKPDHPTSDRRDPRGGASGIEALEGRTLLAFAPVGAEMRVNTSTANDQSSPDVAVDADGDSVVVWQSREQDGSDYGVYAQRHNAFGVRQGLEFRVNTATAGRQQYPRVAMNDAGDFIVTWFSDGQDDPQGGIYAQRYNAAGVPQGGEFHVNTTTAGAQLAPDVAADPAGNFMIAWQSADQISAQMYGPSGNAVGGEFKVNTTGVGTIIYPQVAAGQGGRFLVTWQTQESPPGTANPVGNVRGQRFDATGRAVGAEFQVNTSADTFTYDSGADFDANGNFVVAWDEARDGTDSVMARRYDAAGAPAGAPFRVSTGPVAFKFPLELAMGRNGDFVVAYPAGSATTEILLRAFDSAGAPVGGELRVSTNPTTAKMQPSVGISDNSHVLVTWTSNGQDGSNGGIYAQVYGPVTNPGAIGDFVWNDLNFNGIQDAGEPGLDGVEVTLYTSQTGVMAGRAVSAGGGRYAFNNLRNGELTYIHVTPPAGYALSPVRRGGNTTRDSDIEPSTGRSTNISVPPGSVTTVYDVGLFAAGNVDGRVFVDANGNGVRDAGEAARGGVTVGLAGINQILRTTTTAADGTYRFENVPVSSGPVFEVLVTAPGGFFLSPQDQGTDDTVDSDVNPSNGRSAPLMLNTATPRATVDAGVVPLATVSGTVFEDVNANGVRDPGEIDLFNRTLFLDADNDGVLDEGERSVTSAANSFAFVGVRPGAYRVVLVPRPGEEVTSSIPAGMVTLVPGQHRQNVNLGVRRYAPGANVEPLGPPVQTGLSANMTTFAARANGDFVVAGIEPYGVTQSDVIARVYDAGGMPKGDWVRVNTVTARSQHVPAVAFGAGGQAVVVWYSEESAGHPRGVYGRRLDASGNPVGDEFAVATAAAPVDGNGPWLPGIAVEADGDFIVTWTLEVGGAPDYSEVFARRFTANGEPAGAAFRVNSTTEGAQSSQSAGFDAAGNSVIVWRDSERGEYRGRRYDAAGNTVGEEFRVTGVDQEGSVAVAATGEFIVVGDHVIPGETPNTFLHQLVAVRYDAAGNRLGDPVVVATSTETFFATDVGIDAAGNFIVAGSGSAFRFDHDGNALGRLIPGGEVEVLPDGRFGLLADSDVQWYRPMASRTVVGGFAWDDADYDGVFDPDEQPYQNVLVHLLTASGSWNGSTLTGADGSFRFDPVQAGRTYTLRFHAPEGAALTQADQGPSDDVDSDASPLTATTTFVAPAAGRVDVSRGVGFVRPGRIAGVTFNDRDGDGAVDPGEELLRRWVVFLDQNNNGALDAGERSQTFDLNSSFVFEGVGAGVQRVRVVPQDLWTYSTPAALDVIVRGGTVIVPVGLRTSVPDTRYVAAAPQFRPNTSTANGQGLSHVAADADGDYVLIWHSYLQDGSGDGIYGQRFNAAGERQGAEFRVNTRTAGDQVLAQVASDAAGNFVVVWQGPGATENDIDVWAQRFDAAGARQGEEFRVSQATEGPQTVPDVAMDAAGNFAVVWRHNPTGQPELRLQRFDAAGNRVGDEATLGAAGYKETPSIAMNAGGESVVAWQGSPDAGGELSDVFVQRFAPGGAARGEPVRVNTDTEGRQGAPDVGIDSAGNSVVTWANGVHGVVGGVVRVRRFNAAGTPQGDELALYLPPGAGAATVAVAPDGSHLVTWQRHDPNVPVQDVQGLRFNAAGLAQGPAFTIGNPAGAQAMPSAGFDGQGNFVVTWTNGPDDSNYDVAAQRFVIERPRVTDVFVRGGGWSNDFKQFVAAAGIGDAALGYRLTDGGTLPWINLDQVVLRFDADLHVPALPAQITIDGAGADYTATVSALDARTVVLTLGAPLGVERLRLAHELFGSAFNFRFNVLPGDADQALNRVNAADQGYVKARLNRSIASPGGGDVPSYTVFADVTGDGRINAADQGAVKARLNNALPAASPPFSTATSVPPAPTTDEPILTNSDLRALLA